MYVASSLFSDPTNYATKCNLVSRNDVQFKAEPTNDTLLGMLKREIVTTNKTLMNKTRRNLSSLLDSSDEETASPPKPKRKKKKDKQVSLS